MSRTLPRRTAATLFALGLAAAAAAPAIAAAQRAPLPADPSAVDSASIAALGDQLATTLRTDAPLRPTVPAPARFKSPADSMDYEAARVRAESSTGFRLVVSLEDRMLWALRDGDTLRVAPVAIGVDTIIQYKGRTWRFETPRGRRTILRKDDSPVWIPPDWHYVEVASKRGLRLSYLKPGRGVTLDGGRKLVMRDGAATVVEPDGTATRLPTDEEIVFGDTLFVPPLGSQNRRIPGELGRFKLELGEGYLLHGTPHEDTIGSAATHGCVRLRDEDIEWLFQNVPVGTSVFIY